MARRQKSFFPEIDEDKKQEAEQQIKYRQKETDFDIREYPIEVIVSKFINKLEDDRAEIFIPDYQREMIWSNEQQARFIESILLNLPIPYLYVSDVTEGENEGRLEIVDGSQRIRTLVRFLKNELQLSKLEILDRLNGFYFEDLTLPRQLRFNRKTLRMIELVNMDEEARRQLFDRLNSGGTKLTEMEKRFGSRDGDFIVFISKIVENKKFRELCPVSQVRVRHREYEELALRYFAYLDRYQTFDKSVESFLNTYLDEMNPGFDETKHLTIFQEMLDFVETFFPDGFRKNERNKSVPRIRFEAISVGVSLAIKEGCVVPASMEWLDSNEFKILTRSDASNSKPRVISRINFVRDNLLGREPDFMEQEDVD